MIAKFRVFIGIALLSLLAGCASVEMASIEQDNLRKSFSEPSDEKAGLYLYRNGLLGTAVKRSLSIDGIPVGAPAVKTFFYIEVEPGSRVVATESEFGSNEVSLNTLPGQNYFVQQYLKMGLLTAGANLKLVSPEEGQKGVLECKLAKSDYESWQ